MLVLNRKVGEAIIIDGAIRVVLLSTGRRSAQLGIVAPRETAVLREELTPAEGPPQPDGSGRAAAAPEAS
jgi:carbon storage regulator CsrA